MPIKLFLFSWLLAVTSPHEPQRSPQLYREQIFAVEIAPNRFAVHVKYFMRGRTGRSTWGAFPVRRSLILENFRAYVDGKQARITIDDQGTREACFARQCFGLLYRYRLESPHAEWTMDNHFEFDAPGFSLKGSPELYRTFEYILRTGSAWSDLIDHFAMEVRFLRPVCSQLLSYGYEGKCRDQYTWILDLRGFKPDRDIVLQIPVN